MGHLYPAKDFEQEATEYAFYEFRFEIAYEDSRPQTYEEVHTFLDKFWCKARLC